ncbi:PREDICTED: uncharacterized protein LOC109208303 [Nicotiana attenuata]|uniref:F-box protein n=1 Tax=Nicotiana attenuata TaxID=49451 RepID=A0A314KQN2_NICAT|nr:PREDICTED: uncharacterized protein LOC109208303 [Nicotiana attenuata]OIT31731.1 f-box protein [Nicotiana attenuata]
MASSELPSDMAFEILTRTSLETLDSCKVVNKTWKNLTYKLGFMQVYCHRTNNILGYFVQGLKNNEYVTKFVSMDDCIGKDPLNLPVETLNKPEYRIFNHYHSTKIEASSKQGILCCVRRIKNRNPMYYICKPSTREWKVLANPKMWYQTVKIALVVLKSSPLHFKIIRLSQDSSPPRRRRLGLGNYCCEIFDSETFARRRTNIISLPYDVFFEPSCLPVNVSGLVYFLTDDDHVLVLNYNGKEARPRFLLPEPVIENKDYTDKKLVEYEGKLEFSCLSPNEMLELWCIDNARNHMWNKEKEVDVETVKSVIKYPSPVDFYDSDIALMMGLNKLMLYNEQNSSFDVVKLDRSNYSEIFPFRSDRELIGLKAIGENSG